MAKEIVSASTRAKRRASDNSYTPGFYRALNARTSADSGALADPAQCINLRLPPQDEILSNCFMV